MRTPEPNTVGGTTDMILIGGAELHPALTQARSCASTRRLRRAALRGGAAVRERDSRSGVRRHDGDLGRDGATVAVVVALDDGRRAVLCLSAAGAATTREHRGACRPVRREACEADRSRDVLVDRLGCTAHEVRLVPEAGSARVLSETAATNADAARARPPLEAVEVSPVLAHPKVRREERPHEIFVEQKPVAAHTRPPSTQSGRQLARRWGIRSAQHQVHPVSRPLASRVSVR